MNCRIGEPARSRLKRARSRAAIGIICAFVPAASARRKSRPVVTILSHVRRGRRLRRWILALPRGHPRRRRPPLPPWRSGPQLTQTIPMNSAADSAPVRNAAIRRAPTLMTPALGRSISTELLTTADGELNRALHPEGTRIIVIELADLRGIGGVRFQAGSRRESCR